MALSKMKYFGPDKRQCLVLGNFDYSAIRWRVEEDPEEKGFADLPEV